MWGLALLLSHIAGPPCNTRSTVFAALAIRCLKNTFGNMGNETSSLKIHSLLTAEDIKALRGNFPGAGNGEPPKALTWGQWVHAWDKEDVEAMHTIMRDEQGNITFHAYQEVAGTVHGVSQRDFCGVSVPI